MDPIRPSLLQRPLLTVVISGITIIFVFAMIIDPAQTFRSSLQGLKIWWTIVFPALLPFLVLSELLYTYGFAYGLGIILNPFMRILFRLPGIGGWVWSIGWIAGYPAGAKAVVELRKQHKLSQVEAERLLSLSHVSNPIFVLIVVGVGFMHQAKLGAIIFIVHWISAIFTLIFIRLFDYVYSIVTCSQPTSSHSYNHDKLSTRHVMNEILATDCQPNLPFGKRLSETILSSVQTLMMSGGYMIIFSVFIHILHTVIGSPFSIHILNGLLEVNLGCYIISSAPFYSSLFQVALVGSIIAWSGISIQLQVYSLIRETDLRFSSFIFSRMIHAIIAFILTYILWSPLQRLFHHFDIFNTTSTFTYNPSLTFPSSLYYIIMNTITLASKQSIWVQASLLILLWCLFMLILTGCLRIINWFVNHT